MAGTTNENSFVRIGNGAPGAAGSSTYVDPFTGGGRYVPGSLNQSKLPSSGIFYLKYIF